MILTLLAFAICIAAGLVSLAYVCHLAGKICGWLLDLLLDL